VAIGGKKNALDPGGKRERTQQVSKALWEVFTRQIWNFGKEVPTTTGEDLGEKDGKKALKK